MGLSYRAVANIIMNRPRDARRIFEKAKSQYDNRSDWGLGMEFVRIANDICAHLSDFMQGYHSNQYLERMVQFGARNINEAYTLWINASHTIGRDYSQPLVTDDNAKRPQPRPVWVAGMDNPDQPSVSRLVNIAQKDMSVPYPAGIIIMQDPFSAVEFLYSMRFGYGCCDETVEKLRKVAELRKDEVVPALEEFCRGVSAKYGRKGQHDLADVRVLGIRKFVVEKFLRPMGVQGHNVWVPEETVISAVPMKKGKGFEMLPPSYLDERFLGIDADYIIAAAGRPLEPRFYLDRAGSEGRKTNIISLVILEDYKLQEWARVGYNVGFKGELGVNKECPQFTSLKARDELSLFDNRLKTPCLLKGLMQLLESFVSLDDDNPDSVWLKPEMPITVEDPDIIGMMNYWGAERLMKRLEWARNDGKRVMEENFSGERTAFECARPAFDFLLEDVERRSNSAHTLTGNPIAYEHFLAGLGNAETIKPLHEMLMERQAQAAKLPSVKELDKRLERMLAGYNVDDRVDDILVKAATDAVEKEKEKLKGTRLPFRVSRTVKKKEPEIKVLPFAARAKKEVVDRMRYGRDVMNATIDAAGRSTFGLWEYDEACKRVLGMINRGYAEEYERDVSSQYRGDEPLQIRRYRKKLNSVCKEISPDIVSYKVFV
jgi:hypothetical protein